MYYKYCNALKGKGKYRQLPKEIVDRELIDFSTNDYLGLSKSKLLLEAAKLAGEKFGVGSTGSRLLSGNKQIFEDFESQIAKDKKTESALILNSGFQANIAVLARPVSIGQQTHCFFSIN